MFTAILSHIKFTNSSTQFRCIIKSKHKRNTLCDITEHQQNCTATTF